MQNHFVLTPFLLDQPAPRLHRLAGIDWTIVQPAISDGGALDRMRAIHERLGDIVEAAARRGERPVCVGGDCCATIAVLAALQRAGVDPVLLWFDAHGDFNTPDTTPSGFIGGMPLAMIVGRGDQYLPLASRLRPLPEGDVVLADARNLDPEERVALEGSAVLHIKTVGELPRHIPRQRPVYVHLDVDVLNPLDAPAMSYQTPGGPPLEEFCATARHLAATRRIVAVSMTTWDVDADQDGRSERASWAALGALIGGGGRR